MAAVGLVPALALLAGAACGLVPYVEWAALAWALPVLLALAWAAWCRRRARLCVAAAACAFSCCGAVLAAHARDTALHTSLRATLSEEFGGYLIESRGPGGRHSPVLIRAVLLEDASSDEGLTTLRVAVQALEIRREWRSVGGNVTLTVSGAAGPAEVARWRAGRMIEAPVTFRRPARYENDGVPDFERDLALDGTTLFGSVKSGLVIRVVADGSSIQELAALTRSHVRASVGRWVARHDDITAAVVTAVLIGDRAGLPQDVRLRLQEAGTYHVIAISGGNIAILTVGVLAMLFVCGISGRPAAALALATVAGYACVVAAGPSVWRATLMAAIYLVARLLDHRSPPWHAVGIAAAVAICARPLDVRDVGFILTFGATAALLEGARLVRSLNVTAPAMRWVVASLSASIAAEVALMPVGAWTFGRVTSAGLLLNLLAVPMMGVVQAAGMVIVSFDGVDAVARPAGWIAHAAAGSIIGSARLVDAAPWLAARVPPPPVFVLVAYYLALAGTVAGRGVRRLLAALVLGLSAVAIVRGVPLPVDTTAESSDLRLTLLDVGQADASLLEFPDGRTILIDAGGIPFGSSRFDIGARVVAPALWARGIRRLDALLLTHGDPDHMGGARSVVTDFRPGALWQGVPVPGHDGLRALEEEVIAAGVPLVARRAGEELRFDDVRVRVLHPPPPDWERQRVRNDDSVVLEILYGGVAVLLAGDISAAVEREIAPMLTPARTRILKVPHHGSRTSSSLELLERWRPHIALISCGRANTFGHPAPEVLERLHAIGATIYRTDLDGQITLDTDGRSVRVTTHGPRR